MRLLFVSGTATGGDAVSTRQLTRRLVDNGQDVARLVRRRRRGRSELVASPPGLIRRIASSISGGLWREVQRHTTRQPRLDSEDAGVPTWTSPVPEVVLPRLHADFRPDVLVVSSLHRRAWTAVHAWASRVGLPVILYVRDEATLRAVPIGSLRPDVVVTNCAVHADRAAALGVSSVTVPSLVEFDECRVESDRETVLFVNPVASRGLDIAIALASARPDVPFVFQTSQPLSRRDRNALRRRIHGHANIELRPHQEDLSQVYRDARVLLLPYRVDNRPRVVAEAQSNGIPVLAADLPAHREAVGPGGTFVAPDAPAAAWRDALAALWDEAAVYDRFRSAAAAHARRPEQDPRQIVASFLAVVEKVVAGVAERASA